MDPIPIKILKFQAIHKNKKHRYQPSSNSFLYCLAALTCSLFCFSPLWFPSFFSSMKGFFFGVVPMVSSVFLSSKFVFILGNLIVVALVGESKIFSSSVSSSPNIHVEYEENIKRSQRFQPSSTYIEKEAEKVTSLVEERVLLKNYVIDEHSEQLKMSSCGDEEQDTQGKECEEESKVLVLEEELEEDIVEDEELISSPEDHYFNQRADDFIAWVNERRRYELLLCHGE